MAWTLCGVAVRSGRCVFSGRVIGRENCFGYWPSVSGPTSWTADRRHTKKIVCSWFIFSLLLLLFLFFFLLLRDFSCDTPPLIAASALIDYRLVIANWWLCWQWRATEPENGAAEKSTTHRRTSEKPPEIYATRAKWLLLYAVAVSALRLLCDHHRRCHHHRHVAAIHNCLEQDGLASLWPDETNEAGKTKEWNK